MEREFLVPKDQLEKVVFAGKSLFTVRNETTGNRFTFKVQLLKKADKPIFAVRVLTGPQNEFHYTYLGSYFADDKTFRLTRKSKVGKDNQSYKVFSWFVRNLKNLPDYVLVFHHGFCARCGRLMTVPESVMRTVGPECAKIMGLVA